MKKRILTVLMVAVMVLMTATPLLSLSVKATDNYDAEVTVGATTQSYETMAEALAAAYDTQLAIITY